MSIQMTFVGEFVVTEVATEWFLTSVDSLMGIQIALLCKCFVTIAASESFDMSLHGCTCKREVLTEIKNFNFTIILFSFHSEQQPNIEDCCSTLQASKQLKRT